MSTERVTFRDLSRRISAAGEELAAAVETADEHAFHRRHDGGEWALDEIAGHAAEFPRTVAGWALDGAATPGLTLGRHPDDPHRLASVASMGIASPTDAAHAIRLAVAHCIVLLGGIPIDGWEARVRHTRDGEMTIAEFVARYLLEHLRDHAGQARRALT